MTILLARNLKVFFLMHVTIVIVNFRTPELTIQCLHALSVSQDSKIKFNVLIIDNKSADDSILQINEWIENSGSPREMKLIENCVNNGFSSGNNVGINESTSEYILLLNSDSLVSYQSIELLVKLLQDNPNVGIASPRLEWPDGRPQESCFRFQRPISELISSACTGLVTSLLRRYEVALAVSEEVSCPEWTSFACVMIRREVFDQVGLLDEGFFMYFEDVDFCRRARAAGWGVLCSPEARAVHLRGGSSPLKSQAAQKKRLPRYFYESRTRYYYRYFGYLGLFTANIFWHLGWTIAMVRKLVDRDYKPNVCEKQWRDIWTNFFNPTAPYTHPDNYS
ncbi:glycosyltransferase family 2 protein [SAR92 clade bacterium H455]|uniref:Glycosyltransferase family 2 protein n=1 Tax=SAR92 clade bacterium H455 TaxID=2974818 RepID=A0ABY5TP81_9GAMM|nr:glycosyltransferase family 2 protein [SAR92 clade bacterium H455]